MTPGKKWDAQTHTLPDTKKNIVCFSFLILNNVCTGILIYHDALSPVRQITLAKIYSFVVGNLRNSGFFVRFKQSWFITYACRRYIIKEAIKKEKKQGQSVCLKFKILNKVTAREKMYDWKAQGKRSRRKISRFWVYSRKESKKNAWDVHVQKKIMMIR